MPQHLDPAEVLTTLAHIMQTLQDIDRRLSALEAPTPPPPASTGFFRRHRHQNGTVRP